MHAAWYTALVARELERLENVENEKEALSLRLQGYSYADIGDIQRCHVTTARKRVERAIQGRIPKETRDEGRRIEVERIDLLIRLNLAIVRSTSTTLLEKFRAQELILQAQKRKAAFLGLDMPAQVDVYARGALDAEIESLMGQLRKPLPEFPERAVESSDRPT